MTATLPQPSEACPIGPDWSTLAEVPAGFTGNAGIELGPCQYVVVGDRVAPATAVQEAAVLDVRAGRAEVVASLEARTLWDAARGPDGDLWAAGEERDGSGLLVRQSAAGWEAVEVPAEIGWLYRIRWVGTRLIVASAAPTAAYLSSYSPEAGWQTIATVQTRASEGNAPPEPASLRAITAAGDVVVVAGTDGFGPVVLVSRDAGATFEAQAPQEDVLTAGTAALVTDGRVVVAGYKTTGAEAYEGRLLSLEGERWRDIRLPADTGRVRDATARGGSIYLIAERADGEAVVAVTAETAAPESVPGSGYARFVEPGQDTLAILGAGIYARSLR